MQFLVIKSKKNFLISLDIKDFNDKYIINVDFISICNGHLLKSVWLATMSIECLEEHGHYHKSVIK